MLFLLFILLCTVGYVAYQYGPNFNFYLLPPSPRKDAQIALRKIQANSIYSSSKRRNQEFNVISQKIAKQNSYKKIYPLLQEALTVMCGKHAVLVTNQESKQADEDYKAPMGHVKNNILHIQLPAFAGTNKQGVKYAKKAFDIVNKHAYKGIIIDLSNNTGGNMGPMVAGISSIVPNGTMYKMINSSGTTTKAELKGSVTTNAGQPVKLPKETKKLNVPIAIVTNKWTASSGELTDLAIQNNAKVKTFGHASAGYTSINWTYTMYNGTQLNITTKKIKDNKGNILFNNKLIPDQKTNKPISDAQKWLVKQ